MGPLIESPQPRPVAVLDDWDDSLPLIYFNCGSTGAHPGFLDEACAAAHVWLGAMYATWGKRYDAILNWKQAHEIFRQLDQIEQAENLEKMIAGSPL